MEHKFRYYTDNNGLSSNTIQCLYQDDKGYIWVGSADGLDRFNSCDFTNYRSDYRRYNTLENNCIYSLCSEEFPNDDRIWVGTSDGIYIFDARDESFVRLPVVVDGKEHRKLLIYSLAADVMGNMWIGTLGDGLYRYNLKSRIFEHYTAGKYPEAFSSDVIVKILLDHDNNIWVASGGGALLSRYNPENNRFSTFRVEDSITSEPISRISTLCQDSFGDIWVAGYACELYKFELSRLTFTCNRPEKGESYGRVRSMVEYSPGVMMLGTDYGLVNFNAKNRSFEHIDNGTTNRNGRLNDKFIHSILKDRDGGVWIGTYFGGINYLSPFSSLFTLIEAGEGCGHIISKFCEGPDGNIWIGSDDGGLSLYNPRTGSYTPVAIDSNNPALNIHALTIDRGRLWVGTYGDGLYCYDLHSRRMKHFTQVDTGLDNLDVYSVFRDSQGQLWIGTKMGICRYNDASERISCAFGLGHNSDVVDICEDAQGHLWFASLGKGLIRYDKADGKFSFCSHDPAFGLSDFVSCLAVGGDILWIGTHGSGLCRYNIASGTLTKEFDMLSYGNCAVFQIVQDGGDLWLTTNRGLLKYSPDNGPQSIYRFTSDDGLLANIFNANSGIKSSTGHIYIGCNNGINKFYPYDFTRRENSAKFSVVFADFKLFNRNVPVDGKMLFNTIDYQRSVKLQGRKITFGLDFIALNFSSPLRTVYRYRLENFDDKWITTAPEGSAGLQHVSYTNLPPNRYRFVVSASTGGELFGEEAAVEIIVQPPWWMSRAMIAVYGLLIVLAVTGGSLWLRRRIGRVHREQIASIIRKNKLDLLETKISLFTEVANEICTPVGLIAAPVEEIAKHVGDSLKLRCDVDIIRKNCQRLRMLVNRMMDLKSAELGVKSVGEQWSEFPEMAPLGMPAAAGNAGDGEVPAEDQFKPNVHYGKQKRLPSILLAEGNADFADFFMQHLSDNYTIYWATDGQQALDMLRQRNMSAVVSDAAIKGVDGVMLCAAIRNDPALDHLPVVLVTVDPSSATKVRALQAGADACLDKLLSVDYLDGQIRALIDLRSRLRLKFSKIPYLMVEGNEDISSDNRFMVQVNQYIMDNISNLNLSVDDIAAAVNVSRTVFFSRIKSLTGTTPNEFLRSMRLKTAAELLSKSNNLRITEICYMVGFTSTSYFAKCFHAQFGMLPTEFLEKYRQD